MGLVAPPRIVQRLPRRFGPAPDGHIKVFAERRPRRGRLRRRMHHPIPVQGKWLRQVVAGYFNYHAVPSNTRSLVVFRHRITLLWRRVLRQRGQNAGLAWIRMRKLVNDWLPKPRTLHPWPDARFAVRHPRWEPYARIGPVRICAGGAQ